AVQWPAPTQSPSAAPSATEIRHRPPAPDPYRRLQPGPAAPLTTAGRRRRPDNPPADHDVPDQTDRAPAPPAETSATTKTSGPCGTTARRHPGRQPDHHATKRREPGGHEPPDHR